MEACSGDRARVRRIVLELDADANAQAFYERMGARKMDETPSTIAAGRSPPRMSFDL